MTSFVTYMVLSLLGSVMPGSTSDGSERTFWMPESASAQAPFVDHVFDFINVICYIFLVLITVVLVYFAIRYRRKKDEVNFSGDGPVHSTPLELTWTMVPMLLVVAIFYLGMVGYLDLRRSPSNAYEISVTAQKWSWSFDHPEFAVNQAGEVYVPLGRPVEFLMTSADVLHSCFVPAFRVKQDVVPGRYSRLWFEATKPGTYQLYCTEYCGRDHSKMLALVHVLPEDEFKAAMGKLATEYMDLPEHDLPAYALDRLYNRCASCHSLDGSMVVGPRDGMGDIWQRVTVEDRRRSPVAAMAEPGITTLADYIGDGQGIYENFRGLHPEFDSTIQAALLVSGFRTMQGPWRPSRASSTIVQIDGPHPA